MPSTDFVCPAECGLSASRDHIIVHGAREHNLKNICFAIPKGKLVALTGPSGSGKSSIAVEVLQKECLRQYLESLGMTTDHLSKAKVDHVAGLSPSIGVSQRVTDVNPRSTVGTKTGILTILRNLFASIGRQPCLGCRRVVRQPLQDKAKFTTFEIDGKRHYFGCSDCGRQLEKLQMAHFSFNTSFGACVACKGVGAHTSVDIPSLLHEDKTLRSGGIDFWDEAIAEYYEGVIQAASRHYAFPFDAAVPIRHYTEEQRNFLLYGVTSQHLKEPKRVSDGKFEGIVPYVLRHQKRGELAQYIAREPCPECHGSRLGKLGRSVAVGGKTIVDVAGLSLSELLQWITGLDQQVSEDEQRVVAAFSSALKERTSNLIEVGLGYLSLDRPLPSLSAGEAQRVRLAGLLGSGLTGVLYVLDEPTTGLHPHDTAKLLKTLRRIQEAGNTVLVIEHDLEVIEQADYIVEVGPGGGSKGGEIVASGTPAEVKASATSSTGKYLAEKLTLEPTRPRESRTLTIRGAREHNLKGIDVTIPANQLVVMTGVSGSGKSTLLFGILDKVARNHFNRASGVPGEHVAVDGLGHFNRVVTVDQVTISNAQSSRSNVATYTKLFGLIRDLFASLPEAKARGFGPDKFSFNTSGQRCENCNGAGVVAVDMAFMSGIEMECPLCNGRRFSEELLSVQFQGHSIADVLEMTVSDAIPLFREHQKIASLLELMKEVGLDYLALGQSTATLSGGEAQRIKLAMELSKSGRESTLYLLDEPTTGLHAQEVDTLLRILRRLVSRGNTVVAIEHNLDVISQADTVIDFGPGGGSAGGKIVASGTPQQLAVNPDSLTGRCLRS